MNKYIKCKNCEDGFNLIRNHTCWNCGNNKVKYNKNKKEVLINE